MFRNNIRNKLFILLFFATVLPTLTSLALTDYYTRESIKSGSVEENQRLLYQVKMNIAQYMNKLNEASLSVYNDSSRSSPGLYNIMRYGGSDFSSINEIYRSLQVLLRFDTNIYQVYLLNQNENKSYLMVNDILKTVGDARDPFDKMDTGSASVVIEPVHSSHSYGKSGLPYVPVEQVISFHRKLYQNPNTLQLGVISFDIQLNFISKLINDVETLDSKTIIIDQNGKFIYNPYGNSLNLMDNRQSWFAQIIGSSTERGFFEYSIDGSRGILLFENIKTNYMNWYVVKQVPYSQLYAKARTLAQMRFLNSLSAAQLLSGTVVIIRYVEPNQNGSHINL
jgi:two-component system sensor histidine kinase YesM